MATSHPATRVPPAAILIAEGYRGTMISHHDESWRSHQPAPRGKVVSTGTWDVADSIGKCSERQPSASEGFFHAGSDPVSGPHSDPDGGPWSRSRGGLLGHCPSRLTTL